MSKGIKILLLLMLTGILSCYESDHKYSNVYNISKLYLYNTVNDSIKLLGKGGQSVLLPASERILYEYFDKWSSSLWIYNYSTGVDSQLLNNFYAYLDNDCVSPDESYLIYVRNNSLNKMDLNTGEEELLLNNNNLVEFPQPNYSGDGKKIVYFSYAGYKKQNDSLFVNVYDFTSKTNTKLDTIFIWHDMTKVYFTNDSQKFYVIKTGWAENGYWLVGLTIYNNTDPPVFYRSKDIYLSDYTSNTINITDDNVLILGNNFMYRYDISENYTSEKMNLNPDPFSVRKIKNTDKLIGLRDHNYIDIINYNGEQEAEYSTQIKYIDWIDYDFDNGYIFFKTSQDIPF